MRFTMKVILNVKLKPNNVLFLIHFVAKLFTIVIIHSFIHDFINQRTIIKKYKKLDLKEDYIKEIFPNILHCGIICIPFFIRPMCSDIGHWIAIIVELEKQQIFVFNSLLGYDDIKYARRVEDWIFDLYEVFNMPKVKFSLIINKNKLLQKNAVDCGVYTILFKKNFLLNGEEFTISEDEVAQMRENLKDYFK